VHRVRDHYRGRMIRALLLALLVTSFAAAPASAAPCAPGGVHYLGLLSARTGKVERSFPGVTGVAVVLADGHGGWFVGGSISCLEGLRTTSLVHLDPAGQLDRRWHVGHGAPIGVLAVSGSTVYAGGGSVVEAFDATTGLLRWTTHVQGGFEPGVAALAASPAAVYVGGDFKAVAERRIAPLVALDPRTGALLGWRPPALGCAGSACAIDALALDGSRLFVGGNSITTVGGARRPGFAELDAGTGALAPWTPGTSPAFRPGSGVGDVETIVIAHGLVFSAGLDGFGITDERTGAIARLMRTVRSANRFAAAGNHVYLGGDLRRALLVAGKIGNNLGAVDLATGRIGPWAPNLDTYVGVASIAASPTRVLVAGSFSKTLG
jgi:outer membrane protein assembly factor BamB